jgi:hypothetical protein
MIVFLIWMEFVTISHSYTNDVYLMARGKAASPFLFLFTTWNYYKYIVSISITGFFSTCFEYAQIEKVLFLQWMMVSLL